MISRNNPDLQMPQNHKEDQVFSMVIYPKSKMIATLEKYRPVIYAECNAYFFRKQEISIYDVVNLLSPLRYDFYRVEKRKLEHMESVSEDSQNVFIVPRERKFL